MPKRRPVIKTIIKSLRLTEDEAQTINDKLNETGLSFSQYAIKRLCGYQVKSAVDKQLVFELSRIGNNLNQIARKLNQNGLFDAMAMIAINEIRDNVNKILSQS